MLCQECNIRPATLHFTKIVNGEKTEFHFCETCAKEKGEVIPGSANGFSIHNLLSGLLDFDLANNGAVGVKPQTLRCDNCGMTYSEFSKLGKFGCSECYKHFSDQLDPLLKRVHGNVVHTGKVPERAGGALQQRRELERLKKELHERVEQEEFELAAELRDKIRGLEREIEEES